jgi:hypothetical protein
LTGTVTISYGERQLQGQRQKQVPCGNGRKKSSGKSNGNGKSNSNGKSKSNGKSRFPAGMEERKATAKADPLRE